MKDEKNTQEKQQNYRFSHQLENGVMHVHAHDAEGNKIGSAKISTPDVQDKYLKANRQQFNIKGLLPESIEVHPNHRGKGVGKGLYQYASQITGHPIQRPPKVHQTQDAQNMWGNKTNITPIMNNFINKSEHRDLIPGGLADNNKPSDFNQKQLKEGQKVELEHTKNPKIAREIAMDHLKEDSKYYKKLRLLENKKINKNNLDIKKMSQPSLKFPNIKELPTRPDQEVKMVDPRKKYTVPPKNQEDADIQDISGPKRISQQEIGNKLISNKLTHKLKDKETREANRKSIDYTLKPTTKQQYGGYTISIPEKPESDVMAIGIKNPNNIGDRIEQHEGAHLLLKKLSKHPKYSKEHKDSLVDHLVSKIHPEDYKSIENYLTYNNTYKKTNPNFKEEILNHARDFLVDKNVRYTHDKVFPKSNLDLNRLKKSWKDITQFSKKLTPKQLNEIHSSNMVNKDDKIAASEEIKNNINKGSLQSKFPFNPHEDQNIKTKLAQRSWTHDEFPDVRDNFPKMEKNAKIRALNKLAAQTHARKHPETGERLFLMHRGMSREEKKNHHKEDRTDYPMGSRTSWTPDFNTAEHFSSSHSSPWEKTKENNVVSAWIPESALVHNPNQYNSPQSRSITEQEEKEWFVSHDNHFQHAHPDFVESIKNPKKPIPQSEKKTILNERINVRASKPTSFISNKNNQEINKTITASNNVTSVEDLDINLEKPFKKQSKFPYKKSKKIIKNNDEDYRGDHRAPVNDGYCEPMHGINKIYPQDIYSQKAAQLYGHGVDYDHESIAPIHQSKGKPKEKIKIYRAVPHEPSKEEQIQELNSHKAYILKKGKIPSHVKTTMDKSAYYDHIHNEIERLNKLPESTKNKIKINRGDWVTTSKSYAKEHGESHLGGKGKYKILSAHVPASHLYTDGNSIHEWGYDPGDKTKR